VETLEDLQRVFSLHILPLLQEYFFGDVGKIGLVLGESFVRKKQNIALAKFEAYDKYAQKDLQKREVFELTPTTMWNFEL
jgi:5-methylcytosine-specific restriction enzyme B